MAAAIPMRRGGQLKAKIMSTNHWYIVAALGGFAVGFWYLGTSSNTNATFQSIYTSGAQAGGAAVG
jgi:hypothetical protein